jgi:K+-transporting ATPase KdpF subunit
MLFDFAIPLVVSAALFIYLVIALLWPEKF